VIDRLFRFEWGVGIKDQSVMELVDLPCFGRASRLIWTTDGDTGTSHLRGLQRCPISNRPASDQVYDP
jgi:hypothetical protein